MFAIGGIQGAMIIWGDFSPVSEKVRFFLFVCHCDMLQGDFATRSQTTKSVRNFAHALATSSPGPFVICHNWYRDEKASGNEVDALAKSSSTFYLDAFCGEKMK